MKRRTPEQEDRHQSLVLASIWLAASVVFALAFVLDALYSAAHHLTK